MNALLLAFLLAGGNDASYDEKAQREQLDREASTVVGAFIGVTGGALTGVAIATVPPCQRRSICEVGIAQPFIYIPAIAVASGMMGGVAGYLIGSIVTSTTASSPST
jgi:hypothetical protein